MDEWMVPVVRLRESEPEHDDYGDPIIGSGAISSTPLPDALFAPGGTSEPVEPGATPVITQPTVYWPDKRPDVVATDVLVIDGTKYTVEGKPADWPMGLSVTLKAVEAKTWRK